MLKKDKQEGAMNRLHGYGLHHLYSLASSLLYNLLGYGLGFASRRAIKTEKRGHHEKIKQTFSTNGQTNNEALFQEYFYQDLFPPVFPSPGPRSIQHRSSYLPQLQSPHSSQLHSRVPISQSVCSLSCWQQQQWYIVFALFLESLTIKGVIKGFKNCMTLIRFHLLLWLLSDCPLIALWLLPECSDCSLT